MFDEAFVKLELDDTARILDQIQGDLEGTAFDPIETTIMAAPVPFYTGFHLLEIANQNVHPPVKRFVIYSPQKWKVLDFTNKTVFELNDMVPVHLEQSNITDYVRFFFRFVKGRHGHFFIVESVDDINWKDDPPPQARKGVGGFIKPITLKSAPVKGIFHCTVNMMFKNALFRSDVVVNPQGRVKIENEEILIDDMPVFDDVLGQ